MNNNLKFICKDNEIPMHYFEAMQIFSHIFGMPEIICRGDFDALQDAKDNIILIDETSAISSATLAGIYNASINVKHLLKRYLYIKLSEIYGYSSPWGCMTGVRPTKIADKLMCEGLSKDETADYLRKFYLLSEDKTKLTLETLENQKYFLENKKGCGFYVGVPFCPSICSYCTFGSSPLKQYEKRTDEYTDTLISEIRATAEMMEGKYVPESIYMGGGTPTTLTANQLERVMECVTNTFDTKNVLEFAVEAGRPDSVTYEKLRVLKKYGVTRISINPQTMNLKTLQLVGRKHTPEDTERAFKIAREVGFDNINMDIIAGLPGETEEDFSYTLGKIKEFAPDCLTVHTLSLKRAAALHRDENSMNLLSYDLIGNMTSEAAKTAEVLGMHPFYMYRQKNCLGNGENVCYCIPGKESPYNIHIMEEDMTIIACGVGGVTKVVKDGTIERTFNMKSVPEYFERQEIMLERKEHILCE